MNSTSYDASSLAWTLRILKEIGYAGWSEVLSARA